MKKKINSRGITLIALVITIIVLLILAAVGIATLTGENGILSQATRASEETLIGREKEEALIAYIQAKSKKLMNNISTDVTGDEVNAELRTNGVLNVNATGSGVITVKYDNGHLYIIDDAGNIEFMTEEERNRVVDGYLVSGGVLIVTRGGEVRYVEERFVNQLVQIDITKIETTLLPMNGIKEILYEYIIDNSKKIYNMYFEELENGEYKLRIESLSDKESSVFYNKRIVQIEDELALDDEGNVYAWGGNYEGRLGAGIEDASYYTEEAICLNSIEGNALNGKKIKILKKYSNTRIALDTEGKIYTWGDNSQGQLGNGNYNDSNKPICISDISESALNGKIIEDIIFSRGGAIVRDNKGKIYTWGYNYWGQLGDGTTPITLALSTNINSYRRSQPICISDISGSELKDKQIVKIKKEWDSIYAIDNNGNLYAWGNNSAGTLGDGTTSNRNKPVDINNINGSKLSGKKVVEVRKINSWYGTMAIALDSEGKVYTWGTGADNKLGNGSSEDSASPICISDIEGSVLNGRKITNICNDEESRRMIIVRDNEGKLYTWGKGYLGDGINSESNIPICISDIEGSALKGKNIKEVIFSGGAIFAKDTSGIDYAWGSNIYGQLRSGDESVSDIDMPEISQTEKIQGDVYITKEGIVYYYDYYSNEPV